MKTLKTYTKDTLILLTLAQITEINNEFCDALKSKTTKRFPTKPKAIQKALQNQALYIKSEKVEAPAKPAKVAKVPSKSTGATVKKYELDTLLELGDTPTKEGTAMGILVIPVKNVPAEASELIHRFIKHFEQIRGSSEINDSFARGYVTGALRAGHLKVSK